MTILDAIHDRALFGPWFSTASWRAWVAFLTALFGLPLDGDALALYRAHTGREAPPAAPAREAWVIAGRRAGKSRIAALAALYLACFRSYDAVLAPGEIGTLPIIAADRRQARMVMRYITGFLDAVPALAAMVAARTAETVTLSNRVTIEVHTASFRTLRGYTIVAAVCDEIAFWRSDEGSANPDSEILSALRPGMASVPGALLLAISSPYARKGALWTTWQRHWARDDDPVLVWQAATAVMNPNVDAAVIAEAYAEDESAAAAEYGAEFRRDIESYISREAVDAVVVPGRHELPHSAGRRYVAFVDPSGGSRDSFTLAVAHAEGPRVVIDCAHERRPPFNPSEVVEQFAATLRAYGVTTIVGDRYAGEWPREAFRSHGIRYEPAEQTKSEYYGALLPLLNSGRVELLDEPRLIAQLLGLERRTARGGRDSIDHAPGGHDDVINAAAGALVVAQAKGATLRPRSWSFPGPFGGDSYRPPAPELKGAGGPKVSRQNLAELVKRW